MRYRLSRAERHTIKGRKAVRRRERRALFIKLLWRSMREAITASPLHDDRADAFAYAMSAAHTSR